jgi:hypothetical protein
VFRVVRKNALGERDGVEESLRQLVLAGPRHLGRDRRQPVAELVQRQLLEHDVDEAPERGRDVLLPVLLLDLGLDQRVRFLVLVAEVDPKAIPAVADQLPQGVLGRAVERRCGEVRDELLAGPDAQHAAGRALAEGDREVAVVPVLGDLLPAAQQTAAHLLRVLALDDVGRPDHLPGDPLHPEAEHDGWPWVEPDTLRSPRRGPSMSGPPEPNRKLPSRAPAAASAGPNR